jgi:hypothetical protein
MKVMKSKGSKLNFWSSFSVGGEIWSCIRWVYLHFLFSVYDVRSKEFAIVP